MDILKYNNIEFSQASSEAILAAQAAVTDLLLIEERHNNICIVGGFYRDIATGRQFKDVDVFIPGDMDVSEGAEELEYDLSQNDVFYVDGYDINVIHLQGAHTLASLLDRVDMGICQIGAYLHAPEDVYVSHAFIQDTMNNTLTVTRQSRWNHIERVMQKFPDHRLIDPWNNHTGSRSLF